MRRNSTTRGSIAVLIRLQLYIAKLQGRCNSVGRAVAKRQCCRQSRSGGVGRACRDWSGWTSSDARASSTAAGASTIIT